ncbi:MAG: hypothetical protein IKJ30_00630 [Bacilli bacterium]|nr:hypothetical protein [Bacilli bacterium]
MNEMELLLIIKDELVKLDPLELIIGNSKLIDEYDLEAKYILDEMTNINESNLLAIKISEVFKKTSNEDISSDIFLNCANNILSKIK